MKIELGGGNKKKEGFVNVDLCAGADIQHDLNIIPWPLADESVDELYSAHCIEHLNLGVREILREIARICRVGAKAEVHVPDAISEMAMCHGHVAVISINSMRHADHVFPEHHWAGSPRKLKLMQIEARADNYWFPMARKCDLFARWTDDEIMTWIPRTRHENRFHFEVV